MVSHTGSNTESHGETKLHVGKFSASGLLQTVAWVGVLLGAIGFGMGYVKNPEAMWPAYLQGFFFVSCLALGGLFFTTINNIAKAGWSTSIRRISEGMTSFIPVIAVGGLVLAFLGLKTLYPWARPEEVLAEPVIAAKTAFLNKGFFIVRLVVFGLGMFLFAKATVGNSLQQDQNGDEKFTHRNVAIGVAFLLFFALSYSLFSVDFLMSLMPSWYSTIFGIYCFSGLFQSSLAFLVLLLIYFKRKGFVQGYYSIEHIHDVAKFLKGFTVFWAYIAFSQFMLIWYANIPEETEYYLMRAQNGWMLISMLLLIGKFIIPFLALLPRWAKRTESHLILVAVWILLMQYVDIFWMVGPNFHDNQMSLGFYDFSLLAGFLGIYFLLMIRFFSRHSLVALKDPRLSEALTHHVSY